MNNQLQIFKNEEFGQVRGILINNEPYFVGKEVATVLGYADTKSAIADHVDKEDRTLIQKGQIATLEIPNRGLTIINESGLYSLILSSKLPNAKKFKRWVTSEVLPSIRKNGMYATDELLDNPDLLIEVATKLKEEREKNKVLQEENVKQKQRIGELEPKADYTDLILKSKSIVAVTQIAKDYGMSAQEMNNKLHELKVQYLVGKQWILYAKYQAKGYTHSETIPIKHKDGRADVSMITKWTQKGRLFIYDLLKANGILPMIEREVA